MQSVLNEISKLRSGAPLIIDYHNSNRYRIVAQEKNGTKTAYCFSTPIYNSSTRKLIDMKFRADANTIYATGSNANITLSNHLMMENAEGGISIALPQKPTLLSSQQVRCGACALYPTTNGIAATCDTESSIILQASRPFLNIRSNDRCFALMQEGYKPFAVISCIGSLDMSGSVIAPAKLEYQKLSDKKYRISVSASSSMASRIFFEVNLYENKLFQDTTVESPESIREQRIRRHRVYRKFCRHTASSGCIPEWIIRGSLN